MYFGLRNYRPHLKVCYKIAEFICLFTTLHTENGVNKYVRGCYFGDINETDIGCKLDPTLTNVHNATCDVCDNENYCNGAQLKKKLLQMPILALFVALAHWLNEGNWQKCVMRNIGIHFCFCCCKNGLGQEQSWSSWKANENKRSEYLI